MTTHDLTRAERAVALAYRKEQQARAAHIALLREQAAAGYLAALEVQHGRPRPVAPALTWEAAVAAEQARGLSRWQAMLAAAKAHPALYAAQRGPRPSTPAPRGDEPRNSQWRKGLQK